MEKFKYLSKEIIDQVCYYAPLAEWFSKNQFRLSYFELTHKGCLHMEEYAHYDIVILGRMANAAYTCLEDKTVKSKADRAYNAAMAIQEIYMQEANNLSNDAKKSLYIDATRQQFEYLQSKLIEQIRCYPPLAEWFSKNQFSLSYFGLTNKGCLHMEEQGNYDIVVLGRMANAAYTYLEDKTFETDEDRAYNAAVAIQEIYMQEENKLSDDAKTALYIDINSRKKSKR